MVWVIATILLFWMVWTFGLIFSMATIPWSVKIGVPAGKHVGYMGGFTIKVLLVWLSLVETTTLATGTTEDNVILSNITIKPPSNTSGQLITEDSLKALASSLFKQGFQNQNQHECKNCGKFHSQKNNSGVLSDDEYTSPNPYNQNDDSIKYAKMNETIEIYPSIISTYYFSAISIIGLYILYNLLYKKK